MSTGYSCDLAAARRRRGWFFLLLDLGQGACDMGIEIITGYSLNFCGLFQVAKVPSGPSSQVAQVPRWPKFPGAQVPGGPSSQWPKFPVAQSVVAQVRAATGHRVPVHYNTIIQGGNLL